MDVKELNPNEDEKSLNQEEDSDDEFLRKAFEEEESNEVTDEDDEELPVKKLSEKEALEIYNAELQKRGLNKNYNSWDDVAKSEKQRDTEFAKKGQEKPKHNVESDNLPSNLSERLLKVEAPESKFVLDDIKRDHPGKDPYKVWEQYEFYRKEASLRAEKERAKERMGNPSWSAEEKKREQTSQKYMKNLPVGFSFKK